MRIHEYLIFHITRSLFGGLILALLLCTPQTLFADAGTLERIVAAEREVSYVGVRLKTFTSSRGSHTLEELIVHIPPDISYGRELSVVGEHKGAEGSRGDDRRGDNRRRDRDTDRRNGRERYRWREVKSFFSEKDIELIAQNYNLEKSRSTEKVANHETDLLTITPKFAGRPTHRIFFARENSVILRVEMLDAEDVLRAISVYTRISFDPETVERKWKVFEKEIKPKQRPAPRTLVDPEKTLKAEPIHPGYLPPGFQLQDVHSVRGRKNTIHLIYTDGLSRFSMFETTKKPARHESRHKGPSKVLDGTRVRTYQRGPTHAFSWSSADIHFFLFGAMPADEMEKVVKSIIQKANDK